jgi:hypothetical protein
LNGDHPTIVHPIKTESSLTGEKLPNNSVVKSPLSSQPIEISRINQRTSITNPLGVVLHVILFD